MVECGESHLHGAAQGVFSFGNIYRHLHKHDRARNIKVITPDWGTAALKSRGLERENSVVATWLGHAGVLVELPLQETMSDDGDKKNIWVLFDPIFSTRAGPTQYTGPQRLKSLLVR